MSSIHYPTITRPESYYNYDNKVTMQNIVREEKIAALKAGAKAGAGLLVLSGAAFLALNSWIATSVVMNLFPRSWGVYIRAPITVSSVVTFGVGLAAISALLQKAYSTLISSHVEEARRHWNAAAQIEQKNSPQPSSPIEQNQETKGVDTEKCKDHSHYLLQAALYGTLTLLLCVVSTIVIYFAFKALLVTLISMNLTPFAGSFLEWDWRNTFVIVPTLSTKIVCVLSTAAVYISSSAAVHYLKTKVIDKMVEKAKENWTTARHLYSNVPQYSYLPSAPSLEANGPRG